MPENGNEETVVASTESTTDEQTSQNEQSEDKTSAETNDSSNGDDNRSAIAQKLHYKKKFEDSEKKRLESDSRLKDIEETKMKEKEEYKELYEQEKKGHDGAKARNKEMAIRSKFISEISKKSPLDADDAYRLADLSHVEVDSESGEVIGMSDVVDSLTESKSYLFDTGKKSVNAGAKSQEAAADPETANKEFTPADIAAMSSETFAENKDAITAAQQAGLIK